MQQEHVPSALFNCKAPWEDAKAARETPFGFSSYCGPCGFYISPNLTDFGGFAVECSDIDLLTQNNQELDFLAFAFNVAGNLKPLKRLVEL